MSGGRPLVTLAAAGVGFAVLLGVNMATTPRQTAVATDQSAAAVTSAAPVATASTPVPTSAAAAAAGGGEAPAAPAFPPEAVYVGRASDGRTTVALAVWNDKAAAYLCDGRSAESWLTGTVSGGSVQLSGASSKLTAQRTETGATVSFTLGGRTLTAAVAPAAKPAGLYRAKASNGRTTIG